MTQNEGATRGLQEQISRHSCEINKMDDKIGIVGNVLIDAENSLKCLAVLSNNIDKLAYNDPKQIEVTDV